MNTENNVDTEGLRKNILALIRELMVEMSNDDENIAAYRSGFLSVLTEEEKILLQDRPDLNRLDVLGKKFLELSRMVARYTQNNSET